MGRRGQNDKYMQILDRKMTDTQALRYIVRAREHLNVAMVPLLLYASQLAKHRVLLHKCIHNGQLGQYEFTK